ncbi:MAG: hypothetical protein ABIQ32_04490 [Sphingomicrobium sp.]
MRSFALVVITAFALAGCGGKDAQTENLAASQNLSAESFSSNDTTSIDAATGADANMAEDVQLTVNDTNLEEPELNESNASNSH